MSEYGISSPDLLAEQWTPAQMIIMADQIQRRQAIRAAEQLELIYQGTGAAQGGKKGFQSMRSVTNGLRRMGGLVKRLDPHRLARSFGLSVRTKPEPETQA